MKSKQQLVVGLGILLVVAAALATVIGWVSRDPNSKAGRLKRSLDAVASETDRRDREIEELTKP